MSSSFCDLADDHPVRMRRQQQAHDPKPRLGAHRGEHVGVAMDLLRCVSLHDSIFLLLSKYSCQAGDEANQPAGGGQAAGRQHERAVIMPLDFIDHRSEVVETSGESGQLAFEKVVGKTRSSQQISARASLLEFDHLKRGRPQFHRDCRYRPGRETSRQRA